MDGRKLRGITADDLLYFRDAFFVGIISKAGAAEYQRSVGDLESHGHFCAEFFDDDVCFDPEHAFLRAEHTEIGDVSGAVRQNSKK